MNEMILPSTIDAVVQRASRASDLIRFLAAPRQSLRYVGWVGYENLGDEALFEAVCAYFEPRQVLHHERPHRPSIQNLLDRKRFEHALLGGGTLIGGRYLEPYKSAQTRANGSIVFGTGVQDQAFWSNFPSRGIPLADWMPALEHSDYVGVRGPDSAAALASLGLDAEIVGDPACFFAQPTSFWTPVENRIGINIGQSRGQLWGDEEQVVESLAKTARTLTDNGWKPEFFVVWPEDADITYDLVRRSGLSDPPIHHLYTDARAFLEIVREMQVFVGLKLHASVLALCAAVPTVMLEYRPKCLDFMKSIGMEDHNVRTDKLDPGELVAHIEHLADIGATVSATAAHNMLAFKGLQTLRAANLAGSDRQ